jgi:hypothetical protein
MLRRCVLLAVTAAAVSLSSLSLPAVQASVAPSVSGSLQVDELTLSEEQTTILRDRWGQQLLSRYGADTWAPLKMELEDQDLALLGLPPKNILLAQRYPVPTTFTTGASARSGKPQPEPAPAANSGTAVFAGAGFFGIRPGGWLLLLNGGSVGWCSFAHVYGSPGSYSISTAGHCGNVGDTATVVGVVGNRTPVLMDIGKFSKSTGDGGIGKDWALISVLPQYQHLVTPTMAFWGGPFGMYTKTGETATFTYGGRSLVPTVSTNTDPFLAQQVLHYGHGTGIGAGGTPRSGTAVSWKPTYFTFFGAITPGDSGSGTNTLTGDSVGAQREAAGINTHIYLDGIQPFKTGTGVMAGTRATLVSAALANGQLLPYPAPVPLLP